MMRHYRLDDSRPRGLASECVCGKPGCTRWYSDQVVDALGVDVVLPPAIWRSGPRPASSQFTLPRLALFALLGLVGWCVLAMLVWGLVAGVTVLLGRVL